MGFDGLLSRNYALWKFQNTKNNESRADRLFEEIILKTSQVRGKEWIY